MYTATCNSVDDARRTILDLLVLLSVTGLENDREPVTDGSLDLADAAILDAGPMAVHPDDAAWILQNVRMDALALALSI